MKPPTDIRAENKTVKEVRVPQGGGYFGDVAQESTTLPGNNYFGSVLEKEKPHPALLPPPPPPQPKPLLPNNRPLRRERPQPERLAAILAAPAPLVAAAQPLLDVLVNMPQVLDAEQIAAFHQRVEREVANFQSVCAEVRLLRAIIILASYCLCAAIDEAANQTPWGASTDSDPGPWADYPLAAQFHCDTEGGIKVFQLLIYMTTYQREHVDFLDLLDRILSLGFEGVYRQSNQGLRLLDEMRYKLKAQVKALRNEAADNLAQARLEREAAAVQLPARYYFPEWVEPMLLALLDTAPLLVLLVAAIWYLFFY